MLKTAMSGIIMALLIGQAARADDTLPHQLTIHLPNHAEWQMDVSTNTYMPSRNNNFEGISNLNSFKNIIVSNKSNFVVTRRLISSKNSLIPEPDQSDLFKSDIAIGYATLINKIEYLTDSSLTPLKVNNMSEIIQEKRQFQKRELGGNSIGPITSTYITNQYLMYESLMGHLRQAPLKVGMPHTSSHTLPAIDGTNIAAQTTLTLTKWDEVSDQAVYQFSASADPQAKAAAILRYFLILFHPMNAMEGKKINELKKRAEDQTKESEYTNEIRCQFTASIATGLVTSGKCDSIVNLKSPLFLQSSTTHTDITQKILP